MARIIIGIAGPAGAGKTESAAYIARTYGFHTLAFATPLKSIMSEAFGFSREQLYGSQSTKESVDPRYGYSPRWFMQQFGQGMREVLGQDFWARLAIEKCHDEGNFIIEDVRHDNEAQIILDEHNAPNTNTYVWTLVVPWVPKSTADKSHPSESGWYELPYTHLIMPKAFGFEYLYAELDRAAAACGLIKVSG